MVGLLDPSKGDGTWVENRPSKWQQTWGILGPYVTEPFNAMERMWNSPAIKYGFEPTEQDVADAMTIAGVATTGSAFAPKPKNAIKMGFDGSPPSLGKKVATAASDSKAPPTLREVLDAKARQMELPPDKRVKPDPSRKRLLDQNYRERAPGEFKVKLSDSYPRNPDQNAKLPLNDRARFLVNNREAIGKRLAEKIRAAGQVGADTQFFYHSDGPIYRSARNAGLSHEEARQFLDDFAANYAATSPRTQTEPNLLNTSLVMAKKAAGIPHRQIIGEGTGGISEKGYPMMTGKGGIHGILLDDLEAGGIDVNTNPKPFNFGGNMAGNLSGVTADTHAIRGAIMTGNELMPGQVPEEWIMPASREAYRADPTKLTPDMIIDTLGDQVIGPKGARVKAQTEYPVVADVWHSAADELGVSPAEAQSMGWFGLGSETNLGSQPKTVADLMDERINVTSQVLGIPPEQVAQHYFRRKIPLLSMGGLLGGSMMIGNEEEAQPWQ